MDFMVFLRVQETETWEQIFKSRRNRCSCKNEHPPATLPQDNCCCFLSSSSSSSFPTSLPMFQEMMPAPAWVIPGPTLPCPLVCHLHLGKGVYNVTKVIWSGLTLMCHTFKWQSKLRGSRKSGSCPGPEREVPQCQCLGREVNTGRHSLQQ